MVNLLEEWKKNIISWVGTLGCHIWDQTIFYYFLFLWKLCPTEFSCIVGIGYMTWHATCTYPDPEQLSIVDIGLYDITVQEGPCAHDSSRHLYDV